jgi:hypothetical protein
MKPILAMLAAALLSTVALGVEPGRLDLKPKDGLQTAPASTTEPQAVGDQPQAFGDIPGLTVNTPPPDWIQPGLRLTYYTVVATLPDGPYNYIPDEKGGWVDKNGKHYKREDAGKKASHGYLQANLVALDRRDAALQMAFYLFDGLNTNEPIFKYETGFVGSASTGGDLWLHTDALKELAKDQTDKPTFNPARETGMWVHRKKYTIDQATYEALQIVSVRQDGRGVWIYDMASGALLYSSDVTTLGIQKSVSGERLTAGGAVVRFTTFKGSRTLNLPWAGQPAPDWLGRLKKLDYAGNFNVHVPGSPPTPIKLSVSMERLRSGDDWMLCETTGRMHVPGAMPDVGERLVGTHQLGGLWIPTKALAQLRAGQVLDEDALTRFTTVVDRVDGEYVTLLQTATRQTVELTYRKADGMLVQLKTSERIGPPGMRNEVDLQLTGSQ